MKTTTTAYKAYPYVDVEMLAIAFQSTRQNLRKSQHSFTGWVLECYFDDGSNMVEFARFLEEKIGHFIAIRITSETEGYASVPVDPVPF